MEGILFAKGVVEGREGLREYQARAGYEALTKALQGSAEDVIKIISDAGLRGHGGAGFPTGKKWQFTREAPELPRYLVMNGGEDEPGSRKDRVLLENLPHLVIEGAVLGAFAIGASKTYLYISPIERLFIRSTSVLPYNTAYICYIMSFIKNIWIKNTNNLKRKVISNQFFFTRPDALWDKSSKISVNTRKI